MSGGEQVPVRVSTPYHTDPAQTALSCLDGKCVAALPDAQCREGTKSCEGVCRNTLNDNNCCSDHYQCCLQGQECQDGSYVYAGNNQQCSTGQMLYTKGCKNLDNDNDNCGCRCNKWVAGESCRGGKCVQ